jgi:CO/xanthine dehydrogenase FAD-binding subunit
LHPGSCQSRVPQIKPPPFKYYDPETIDEATALLAEHGDEAKVLAGGQSLIPMMSLRLAYPEVIIDVNRVTELDHLTQRAGALVVGALTRHAAIERSPEVVARCPLLAAAMEWVAHEAIRTRGTIGGSLAHADPAAELPAVATALGATVTARNAAGEREIPIGELFEMPLVSSLGADELLTEVTLPIQPSAAGSAVREIARRHGDFAIAGVAATLVLADGRVTDARLVAFATGPTPMLLTGAADVLLGAEPSDERLTEAGRVAQAEIAPLDDFHASATYRRQVTAVLVERAVAAAAEDALSRQMEGA